MSSYVLRLWLADRPGALGQVATAIGAAGGDVVGIDILERGAGRAIDELVVDLPDEQSVDELIAAVLTVEGVDVEEVRPVVDALHDPRLDALETAAVIVGATDRHELVSALATHATRVTGGMWCSVVELESGGVVALHGDAPSAAWVAAFVEGSRSSARVASGESGPDDVAWSPLPSTGLAIVIGRDGVAYRARERRQLAALARIADTRLREILRTRALLRHPSVG